MLLSIVVLVVAIGRRNFIKNGPIRLLFRREERGSRLVSRRIVVLRTKSVLRSLSFVFARCRLSSLAVGRPLLLRTMSFLRSFVGYLRTMSQALGFWSLVSTGPF